MSEILNDSNMSFWLPDEMKARFVQKCKTEHINMSAFFRGKIEEFLEA